MRTYCSVLGCGLVLALAASQAPAATILSDTFETYADQAALDAAWPASTAGQAATFSTVQAFSPTHSLSAGTLAQRSERVIAETTHSAANPITFSFRFYDNNATAGSREYGDLVDGAGTGNGQLIEMGLNNNVATTSYMARVVGFDGGQGVGAFFKLDGTGVPTRSVAFHELKAILTPSGVSFFVDGVASKTIDWSGDAAAKARSYDKVRLGSNLTSVQVAYFDNVLVSTDPVPEPATLSLLALTALPLLARRRRD